MIPLPDDISTDDVQQWLGKGMFFCEVKPGHMAICSLVKIKNNKQIEVADQKTGNLLLTSYSSVFAHWPECGAINVPDYKSAFYAERIPHKQWCRTYRPSYVKVCSFDINSGQPKGDTGLFVESLFNPTYPSGLQMAVNRITHKEWSAVAITKDITIAKSSTSPGLNKLNVYLYNDKIGVYNVKDNVVQTDNANMSRCLERIFEEVHHESA